MKTAFAYWNNRIAPVFDTARHIHVVDSRSGQIFSETREFLPETFSVQKALRLVELGIDSLVCGAISRSQYGIISAYGIRVVPFVAGDLDEVVRAWVSNSLDQDAFAMPGCCGRRRGWFGGAAGPEGRQGVAMDGRRGAGGGGKGRGGGSGAGRGPGRQRTGPAGDPPDAGAVGFCSCPRCGRREPREPGVPCVNRVCPDCGIAMVRQ